MTNEEKNKAKMVFESLCSLLDAHKWLTRKNEEELSVDCDAQGEDLPMAITVRVDAEMQLIQLVSHLPFVVAEEQRLEVAIAVAVINKKLPDGNFEYDFHNGNLFFRMTTSFIESEVSNGVFAYLLMVSFTTIEKYNDKFFMLGRGAISLEDFISESYSSGKVEKTTVDIEKQVLAKRVFEDLCLALERKGWSYKTHEEMLVVTCSVSGADIPMGLILIVDAERQLLKVLSRLPFTVPEDKRMELAVAACVATFGLADGNFDYDVAKGTIDFRLTAVFGESKIGEGLFTYLVEFSSSVVDRYNDRFLALCKGLISIDAFILKG